VLGIAKLLPQIVPVKRETLQVVSLAMTGLMRGGLPTFPHPDSTDGELWGPQAVRTVVCVLLELGQAWNDFASRVSVIFRSFSPSESEFISVAPAGLADFPALTTHSLRPFDKLRAGCGLHSFAALRLNCKSGLRGSGKVTSARFDSGRSEDRDRAVAICAGRGRCDWGRPFVRR
jgi:hypothetical protein